MNPIRTWKERNLGNLERTFSKQYEEWKELKVSDDRYVFSRLYEEVHAAVTSLTDEPATGVKVAMNAYIRDSVKTLDEIAHLFGVKV